MTKSNPSPREKEITRTAVPSDTQWAVVGNEFKFTGATVPRLPSGLYKIIYDSRDGVYKFVQVSAEMDDLLILPHEALTKIIRDVEFFWSKQSVYEKYKYVYKRGVLLYGEPGCGKSCIIALLAKIIMAEHDGIIISIDTRDAIYGLIETIHKFAHVESGRKFIVVFEDIDTHTEDKETLSKLLNIFDGLDNVSNVMIIGTTNYPEKLEQRITNRPSRFDRRYEIGRANADIRRFYLEHKLTEEDKNNIDVESIVKRTEGYTIDHLKELVLSVFILGYPFEDALAEVDAINKTRILKNSEARPPGFKK